MIGAFDSAYIDALAEALAPKIAASLPAPESATGADGWLDSATAADYLGISVDALYKLTSANVITLSRTCEGAPLYFRRSDLDAYREQFLIPARVPSC